MDKGFVGGTRDNTGLSHLGAREYDPNLGRFISVDPVIDTDGPQQMHGYAYANNNPSTDSDATGLMFDNEGGGGGSSNACTGTCAVYRQRYMSVASANKRDPKPAPPPPTCSVNTPEYCHAQDLAKRVRTTWVANGYMMKQSDSYRRTPAAWY
jgi:RHS repeat-associated protein